MTVADRLVSKREMGKTIFAQIRNLKSESSIAFRKDLNRTTIAKTLKHHHAAIQRKPHALR